MIAATRKLCGDSRLGKPASFSLRFTKSPCAKNQYASGASAWAAPGINCYSLIGRIGTNGVVFLVGPSFQLRSPVAGELYLGFNDDVYWDNGGEFDATVTTP